MKASVCGSEQKQQQQQIGGGVPVYGSVEWKRSSPGFNINSSSSRGKSMEAAAEDLLCLSVMGVVGDAGWGVMQRNRWKFN